MYMRILLIRLTLLSSKKTTNPKPKNILSCDSGCTGVMKIFEAKGFNISCSLLKLDGIYPNITIKSFRVATIKLYSIFIRTIAVFMAAQIQNCALHVVRSRIHEL